MNKIFLRSSIGLILVTIVLRSPIYSTLILNKLTIEAGFEIKITPIKPTIHAMTSLYVTYSFKRKYPKIVHKIGDTIMTAVASPIGIKIIPSTQAQVDKSCNTNTIKVHI